MWTYMWQIGIKIIFTYEWQNSFKLLFLLYVCFPTHMYVHSVGAWYSQRPKHGNKAPGIGISEACELPCVFLELYLGPLKEGMNLQTPNIRYPRHRTATWYPWGAIVRVNYWWWMKQKPETLRQNKDLW